MDYAVVALVMVLSFALYVKTLAPTVVWGDPAKLTTFAYNCELGVLPGNHALRTLVGCLWGRISFGDYAFGQNLLSAVFASLTLGVIYLSLRALEVATFPASLGGLALGVSHTFWWLAVIAESYSLFFFLLSVCVFSAIAWAKSREDHFLYLLAFAFGLGITNHAMMLLFAPAFGFYFLLQDRRLLFNLGRSARFCAAFLAGSSLLVVLFIFALRSSTAAQVLSMMTFRELSLHWEGIGKMARETAMYPLYLAYQFPGLGVLLGGVGIWALLRRDKKTFAFLSSIFVLDVVFSAGYMVQRQFMIIVPSYIVFSLCVGGGIAWLWDKVGTVAKNKFILVSHGAVLAVFLVFVPVLIYYAVPSVLLHTGISPLDIRRLPYRDTIRYFFLPDKSGYDGAARYGREVIEMLPRRAVVLADFHTGVVLQYLQTVEGLRSDVAIVRIENHPPGKRTLEAVNQYSDQRPIYLTDYRAHARYFAVNKLSQEYEFVPQGLVFLLRRKS